MVATLHSYVLSNNCGTQRTWDNFGRQAPDLVPFCIADFLGGGHIAGGVVAPWIPDKTLDVALLPRGGGVSLALERVFSCLP